MNSIFTNALPGQNEDEHTYTLKERFNQSNSVHTSNEGNLHGYDEGRGDEMEMHQQCGLPKYKDYNSQELLMDDYNMHSRSHHRNRSRSRERDRDREKDRYRERERSRDNQRSRSKRYSRSDSREYRRSHSRINDYRKKKGEGGYYGRNNYQRSYSSFSYTENGVVKINMDFTVPDHLVSLLIGKKGENVRSIMNSTGAVITFSKEVIIIII